MKQTCEDVNYCEVFLGLDGLNLLLIHFDHLSKSDPEVFAKNVIFSAFPPQNVFF